MRVASWGFIQRPMIDLDRPKEWRGKPAYEGLIIEKGKGSYDVCGHIHNSEREAEECATRLIKMPWDLSDVGA